MEDKILYDCTKKFNCAKIEIESFISAIRFNNMSISRSISRYKWYFRNIIPILLSYYNRLQSFPREKLYFSEQTFKLRKRYQTLKKIFRGNCRWNCADVQYLELHYYASIFFDIALRRRRTISIDRQKTDDRMHTDNELQYGSLSHFRFTIGGKGRKTIEHGTNVEICINKLSDGHKLPENARVFLRRTFMGNAILRLDSERIPVSQSLCLSFSFPPSQGSGRGFRLRSYFLLEKENTRFLRRKHVYGEYGGGQ